MISDEERAVTTHTVVSIFSLAPKKTNQDPQHLQIIQACKGGRFRYALSLSYILCEEAENTSELPAICCERGWTPLHYACSFSITKHNVMENLIKVGYDPRSKDLLGVTPLHIACQYGPRKIVRLLVDDLAARNYSIERECIDFQGNTPVHCACQYGQIGIVVELLKHVKKEMMVQHNFQGETPLIIALKQGEIDIVMKCAAAVVPVEIILKHITEDASTVFFHSACKKGRKDAVDFLLQSGFELTKVKKMYGVSALSIANRYGCKEIVAALIEYGHHQQALTLETTTPLHNACEYGHLDVVKKLMCDYSYDPREKNSNGESPLFLAYRNRHYAVVRYIQQWVNSKRDALENRIVVESPTDIHNIMITAHGDVNNTMITDHDNASMSTTAILEAIERPIAQQTLEQQLYNACQRGDLFQVRFLCESKVNPLLPIREDGATAWHIVCENGYSDIVAYLIDTPHKCDPMATTLNGSTAFHCANNPIQNLDPIRQLRVLEELFGLYFREHFGDTGTYPTHSGITIHEERQINIHHLRHYNLLDLNRKNAEGKTAFHYACLSGLKDNVRLLLRIGCDPEQIDKDGNTAMHLACLSGNAETISALFEYNRRLCNPKYTNKNLDTPLHFAASTGKMELTTSSLNLFQRITLFFKQIPRNRINDTPLHEACRSGSVSFVRFLVEKMNYSIKATNIYGETALFSACCKSGNVRVVEYLITRMQSLKVRNRAGDSPLHKACEFGQYEIVELLIDRSEKNYLKLLCNNNGFTPLHTACSFGEAAVVQYLLECSLWDPNQPNNRGRTPLHCIFVGLELELCSFNAARKTLARLLTVRNLNLSPLDQYGQTPFSMCESPELAVSLLCCMDNCAELYMKYGSKMQPQTLPGSLLNIFVLGNRDVGKSSLIVALQDEKWHLIAQNVTGVLPYTVGIVPTTFASKMYGQVNFLELAGHYEYYAGHSAILQVCASSKVPPIFLILINLKESSSDIRKRLGYWLSFLKNQYPALDIIPITIVVGSHSDRVPKQDLQSKREIIDDVAKHYSFMKYLGSITLDSRKPSSTGMETLRNKLKHIESDRIGSITPMANYVLLYMKHNLKSEVALTVSDVERRISSSSWFQVPEIFSTNPYLPLFDPQQHTLEICRELSEHGHTLLLEQAEKSTSWVVINVHKMLSTVMGSLFVSTRDISSQPCTGVIAFSEIKKHFCTVNVDADVVIQFLCHFEFCHEVSDSQVLELIGAESGNRIISMESERYFFFPGLIQIAAPATVWESDVRYTYYSAWTLECMELEYGQYLTPRFLEVLLLRLMFGCALPSADQTILLPGCIPDFKRKCIVWKNGIQWRDHGMQIIVELTEQNTKVIALLRCREDSKLKCVTLRSKIVHEIQKAKTQFCNHTHVSESFLHPQNLQNYPVSTTTLKFNIHSIAQAIADPHNRPQLVLDNYGESDIPLSDLLFFEPYADLCPTILCQLLNETISSTYVTNRFLESLDTHCITTNNHERGKYFAVMLGYHSVTVEEISSVFTNWKNRTNSTFAGLHNCFDQYTVFQGITGREMLLVSNDSVSLPFWYILHHVYKEKREH